MSRRNQAAGYHCEGDDERIHHLTANTTRDLRRQLRPMGIRVGRWRSISVGDALYACEWDAGTGREPGAKALLIGRGGRVCGVVYRHGGRVLRRSKRERREDLEAWENAQEKAREWLSSYDAITDPETGLVVRYVPRAQNTVTANG